MKKLLLIIVLCSMLGCNSVGGLTLKPSEIDWMQTSKYYHEYVAGLISPVGATAAMIVAPEAAPLIALATKQVGNLDRLIASKASKEEIQKQSQIIQESLLEINAIVGSKQ